MRIVSKSKRMLFSVLLTACMAMCIGAATMLNRQKASAAESYTAMDESNLPSGAETLVQTAKDQDKYAEFTIKNVSSGSNWSLHDKDIMIAFDEAVKPDGTVLAPNLVYTGDASTKVQWFQNRGKIVYQGFVNADAAVGSYPNKWNAQYATPYQEELYKNGDNNILCLNLNNLVTYIGAFSDTETQELKFLKGFTIVDRDGNAFVLKEDYTFYRKNGFFTTASDIADVTAAKTYSVKPTSIAISGNAMTVNVSGDSIGNTWTHGNLAYADLDKVTLGDSNLQGLIWGGQLSSNTAFPLTFKTAPTFTDGQALTFEAGATFMWRGNGTVAAKTELTKVVVSEKTTFWYDATAGAFTSVNPNVLTVPAGAVSYVNAAYEAGKYHEVTVKNVSSAYHTAWGGDLAAKPYNNVLSIAFNGVDDVDFHLQEVTYAGNSGYISVNGTDSTKNVWSVAAQYFGSKVAYLNISNAGTLSNEGVDTLTLKTGFTLIAKNGTALVLKEDCTFYRVNGYFVSEQDVADFANRDDVVPFANHIGSVEYSGSTLTLNLADAAVSVGATGHLAYVGLDKIKINGQKQVGKIYVADASELTMQLTFNEATTFAKGDVLTIEEGFTIMHRGDGSGVTIDKLVKGIINREQRFVYDGEGFAAYEPVIYGASLTLENNIAVNYYVAKEYVEYSSTEATMDITFMGETKTVTGTVNGDYYVFTFAEVNPKYLGENLSATLNVTYAGTAKSVTMAEYSVEAYCKNTLAADGTSAALKTLIMDLINYGAAAQTYTSYKTDDLVSADFDEYQSFATATTPEMTSVLGQTGATDKAATWYGASLLLSENVVAKFFFTAEDATGYTAKVTVEGTPTVITDIVKSGNYYTFEFDALNATQLSSDITVEIYNGDELVSSTLTYSVESYAANKATDGNQKLANLVVAMMKYGNSAKNYQ